MLSFRRWRPRHLLASWLVYWLGLGAVTLGPAIAAIWRVVGVNTGSVNASMGDNGITLNVVLNGGTVYEGTTSLMRLAMLVAGPPIALWIAWMARRPSRSVAALGAQEESPRALKEPEPDGIHVARAPERAEPRRKT